MLRPSGTSTIEDTYEYNALGQRLKATINNYVTRYVYFGDRVVEDNSATGTVLAWHTVSGPSYGDNWLHMKRWDSIHCYPAIDLEGSTRKIVDGAVGLVTDTYTLDAFGVKMASDTGTTKNPYRYDGQWGYFREASGLYQLGYQVLLARARSVPPAGPDRGWDELVRVRGKQPGGRG